MLGWCVLQSKDVTGPPE